MKTAKNFLGTDINYIRNHRACSYIYVCMYTKASSHAVCYYCSPICTNVYITLANVSCTVTVQTLEVCNNHKHYPTNWLAI